MPFSELIGNLAQNPAAPLGDFLALGKQGGFDDLKKEKTHIVLDDHLLNDIVNIGVELLHQLVDLVELTLNAFD